MKKLNLTIQKLIVSILVHDDVKLGILMYVKQELRDRRN